ncbi:FHA domain-containing protein, partial [Streptomyces luteogriseus]|uniref:FHA domain-containing protein n=1 Tax=Streptomyces luteogriseus TaxID=68233 RepID=UPI003797BFE8
MQIRLTVVDPLGPSAPARDRAPRSDVLVTAPAGTALAAVASALAQVVSGGDGSGTPVLYAGEQRLDAQRCTLGEPPLTDGAVLSVGAPGEPEPHPELDDAPAQLQVVAGPDAGGVHLLHGGEIRVGRSADADVPLDDPDVSRLHCTVTVSADGRVAVADLDSTNGTTVNGTRVGGQAVPFAPGALLRIGESALRLVPAGGPGGRVETTPDGEGHVRVAGPAGDPSASHARVTDPKPAGPAGTTHHTYGSAAWGTPGASGPGPADPAMVPGQGGAPRIESGGAGTTSEAPEGRGNGSGSRPAGGGETYSGGGRSEVPPGGAARTADSRIPAPARGTGGAARGGDSRGQAPARGAGDAADGRGGVPPRGAGGTGDSRNQAPARGAGGAGHAGDRRGQAPARGTGDAARAGDGRSGVPPRGAAGVGDGRNQASPRGAGAAPHTGDAWSDAPARGATGAGDNRSQAPAQGAEGAGRDGDRRGQAPARGTGDAARAGDGRSGVPPRGATGAGDKRSQAPAQGAEGAGRDGDRRGQAPARGTGDAAR